MENLVIKHLRQTCLACPSQWSGISVNNETVYIRYRWGCLTVSVEDKLYFSSRIGDLFDGVISLDDVIEATGIIYERSE